MQVTIHRLTCSLAVLMIVGCDGIKAPDGEIPSGVLMGSIETFTPQFPLQLEATALLHLETTPTRPCPSFSGYGEIPSFGPQVLQLPGGVIRILQLQLAGPNDVSSIRGWWIRQEQLTYMKVGPWPRGEDTFFVREEYGSGKQSLHILLRGETAYDSRYAKDLWAWADEFLARCAPE